MQNQARHSKLLKTGLWLTGIATAGFMLADLIIRPTSVWLSLMPAYCLAAFALLHSFSHMNIRQALWFLFLGLVLPFVAEWLGTSFGAIFGSHHFVRARELAVEVGVMLPGGIPLAVVLTWYGMVYLAFMVSVHLLRARTSDINAFTAVPMTGGLLVAFWQLTAGPVAITRGFARFAQDGFYHGLPLSSFVGWFVTTMFVLLFFQAIEPDAVDDARLQTSGRAASLGYAVFGLVLLYPTLLCFRFGLTGAGWLGGAVILLYLLLLAVRARAPRPVARLSPAANQTG